MMRILLMVFIALESNGFVEHVNAVCTEISHTSKECSSVTELSANYFNKSLENLQDVRSLYVRNNGSQLVVRPYAFRNLINLEGIAIEKSQIKRISKNTFRDLPLKSLYIFHNHIREIEPGAFLNLSSLYKLVANNNCLKTIPRGVFKDLPRLYYLTLGENEISSIEDFALENLPQLRQLCLNNNKIDAIFIHKFVSHPEQLEKLWMHNNSLTILTNFMLQKLTKLKMLNLEFNEISLIESNTFEQTPQLKLLKLSYNRLKEVDGNIFPKTGLNFLETLYLDNNELMFLSSSFFLRLRSLKTIELVGNPWLCTCLDFIRRILVDNEIIERYHNMYAAGQRPICVNKDVRSKVCSYKYNKELSDIYMDHRRTFPVFTVD